jgi:hypothetical protein
VVHTSLKRLCGSMCWRLGLSRDMSVQRSGNVGQDDGRCNQLGLSIGTMHIF